MPNLIQIGQKTQKLEIFIFGRFWLVGLVGRKMVVGISNSFYVVFAPLLAPIPNFIQIGQKTQKLEIFIFGPFWLVGLVGRKMVVSISNSFYFVFTPLLRAKRVSSNASPNYHGDDDTNNNTSVCDYTTFKTYVLRANWNYEFCYNRGK